MIVEGLNFCHFLKHIFTLQAFGLPSEESRRLEKSAHHVLAGPNCSDSRSSPIFVEHRNRRKTSRHKRTLHPTRKQTFISLPLPIRSKIKI